MNFRSLALFACKPLVLVLVVILPFVLANAHATTERWENASTGFSNSSVTCAACHTLSVDTNLTVSGPPSVGAGETTADFTLSGVVSGSSYSWRYRINASANDAGNFIEEGGTNPTIAIGSGSSDLNVDYCLGHNPSNGNSSQPKFYNCGSFTIDRLDPPNSPPTVTPASLRDLAFVITNSEVTEADAQIVSISANDADNDPLTYAIRETGGVVSIAGGDGTYSISPVRGGPGSVSISVSDGVNEAVIRTFSVVVNVEAPIPGPGPGPIITPVDNLPVIEMVDPGSLSLDVGSSDRLQMVATDDNPGLQYQSTSNDGDIATVENLGNGDFLVTGRGQGSTEIVLTVIDSMSQSVERSVVVQVSATNQPPIANDDSFVITDLAVAQLLNVLDNDEDPEEGALRIVLDSTQSNLGGSLSVSGGRVSYTPAIEFNSEDSFTYRAIDPGGLSASATVTLTQSDADGDGVFDSTDNCLVFDNPNQLDMDTDGLGDLCDPDPDGDGLPGISGEIFDSGRVLVEAQCLVCHNDESTGAPLFNDVTAWGARIAAAGTLENLVGSVTNGLGTMPAFGSRFSAKELTEAVRYLSGQEGDTSVPIGDRDLDQILDGDDNCPGIANTNQTDSDENGVGDLCEPLADNDGDGYPLSLDDDDSNGFRLPAEGGATSGTSYFLGEGALSLGRHARELARQNGFSSASVTLLDREFPAVATALDSGVAHSTDLLTSTTIGIISLDVESQGGVAALRIQLVSALPLSPVLRVYDASSGLWSDFSANGSDSVASAQAIQGECPAIASSNYSDVLQAGANCVRILIQDGGVNDSDGVVDGNVALLGNLGESVSNDSASGSGSGGNDVDTSPSKSGGAFSLLMIFFMGLVGLWGRSLSVHSRPG